MHDDGVIHRDINPSNIFIEDPEKLSIKIIDFNVSKLMHEE